MGAAERMMLQLGSYIPTQVPLLLMPSGTARAQRDPETAQSEARDLMEKSYHVMSNKQALIQT